MEMIPLLIDFTSLCSEFTKQPPHLLRDSEISQISHKYLTDFSKISHRFLTEIQLSQEVTNSAM